MKGIFQGILVVHENDYIHRDIKPENIMLDSTDSLRSENVKLVDFGLSATFKLSIKEQPTEKIGTILFMAPE